MKRLADMGATLRCDGPDLKWTTREDWNALTPAIIKSATATLFILVELEHFELALQKNGHGTRTIFYFELFFISLQKKKLDPCQRHHGGVKF